MKKGLRYCILIVILMGTSIISIAQMAINTNGTGPNSSAMLDVTSTSKGFLAPRIALTSTSTAAPVTSPAAGLLIYNTATTGDVTPGFYYWETSKWQRVIDPLSNAFIRNQGIVQPGSNLNVSGFGYFGDKIAIGTTTPSVNAMLTLDGASNREPSIWFQTADAITSGLSFRSTTIGEAAYIQYRSEEDGLYLWDKTSSGHGIIFGTSNNERLRIAQNGYIGVGTNNPAAKLHLNSLSSDPLGFPAILMTIDRGSTNYPFVKIGTDGAGGGNIDLYGDDNVDVSTRISADDNSYLNTYSGNVGIGTFTPSAKLDVAGTVRITGGSPGTGKVLTSDATGLASWTTPKAGTVTSITAGAPLTGGTITSSGTIGITQANSTTNGYLASYDWNTFNNKGTGSVTSVNSGTGLSGGPFTTSGTISMANMAANTIKGNNTAGLAAPTDISVGTNQVLGRIAGNITGIPIGTSAGNVAAGNHTHTVPGADQQVIFNASGVLSGNSNFKWANNYKTIQLGNFPAYSPYNPWAALPGLNIANYGNYNGGTTCGLANITMSSNLGFDNGRSNNIYFFRSRDETNAGGAAGRVIQYDCLGSLDWSGWNYQFQGFSMDWGHQWGAGIHVWVDGVVSDDIMPTTMSIGSTKDLVFNTAQLERMRILADGNVGIGTATPGAYKLYVAGNAWSTGTWGSSDERWKKDIAPITNALGKVSLLQGVTYKWRISEFPQNGFEEGTHYGLIAQQVEKVVPELVKTNTDGYKAVSYDKISALLIEAIKEQQKQIELLKKEITELKRQK